MSDGDYQNMRQVEPAWAANFKVELLKLLQAQDITTFFGWDDGCIYCTKKDEPNEFKFNPFEFGLGEFD